MKKYLLSTFAVITALTVGTAAKAQMIPTMTHAYGRVDAGWSLGTGNTDRAGFVDVGMGGRVNQYFDADMTLEYRPWGEQKLSSDGVTEKADMYALGAMVNVYAAYPIWNRLSMYATGGIGYAYTNVDSTTLFEGKGKSNFAWKIGAGMEFSLTDCIGIDLGYRYSDLGKARAKVKATGGSFTEKVRYNDIKLGMKYYF